MQKRRILVLVEHFGQGGAERMAMMLADMLFETERFEIFCYAIYDDKHPTYNNAVKFGTLGLKPAITSRSKVAGYYYRVKRLSKLKKELGISLTISTLFPVDWVNAFTGRDKKVAVIQINILNNQQNVKMIRFKRLVSFVYNRMDAIVLGASNLKAELTDFFKIPKERITVILNAIDTKKIEKNIEAPLLSRLAYLLSSYKVCTIANRLSSIKNTVALIDIYKQLSSVDSVKFLIIGEGEEKSNIQERIKEHGLTWSQVEDEQFDEKASFYFLNFQPNIHNIINRSALFLFPTKGEGLPLALLEAMCCGVPVVVSDCPNGGISEVMEPQTSYNPSTQRSIPEKTKGGYLMPMPSVHQRNTIIIWAETIERLLNINEDVRKQFAIANKDRAFQFDKELAKLQWLEFVDKILSNDN